MFRWAQNTSRVSQSFFNTNGDAVSVDPGGIFDFTRVSSIPSHFSPVKNLISAVDNNRPFYIQRTYALGDMLMGIPAVRACRTLGLQAHMRVEARHAGIMQRLEVPYITTNERTDMPGIILDWVLERDHTDPDLGKLHRTEIYFKALGIPMPELDWSMDPRRFPDVPVTGKYVVMVGQGSNSRKKLPDMTVDKILRKLVDNGIKVCYNGEPELDIAGVEFLRRRLSVPELFSLIFHSQALITVDSGPLWIAHFASSPIVAILGPSHFKQRTVLHPLYPEGVYNIQMNDWLGCRSCTENGIGCREEYRCLNMNGDRLADEVLLGTKKYMSEV